MSDVYMFTDGCAVKIRTKQKIPCKEQLTGLKYGSFNKNIFNQIRSPGGRQMLKQMAHWLLLEKTWGVDYMPLLNQYERVQNFKQILLTNPCEIILPEDVRARMSVEFAATVRQTTRLSILLKGPHKVESFLRVEQLLHNRQIKFSYLEGRTFLIESNAGEIPLVVNELKHELAAVVKIIGK